MTKAKNSYSVLKRYRRRQSTYFCPNFRKWSKVLIFLKSMFSRHLVQIYLPIIDSIILLQSFDFDFLMIESPASSKDHVQRNLWKAFLQTLKLSWLNLSNPSLFPFFTPVDPSSLELRAWEGMNRSRLHLSLGLRVLAFFFLIARWSSSCQLLGVLVAESLRICFNTFLKFHLTWSLLEAGVSIMRKSRFNECSKIIESIILNQLTVSECPWWR